MLIQSTYIHGFLKAGRIESLGVLGASKCNSIHLDCACCEHGQRT